MPDPTVSLYAGPRLPAVASAGLYRCSKPGPRRRAGFRRARRRTAAASVDAGRLSRVRSRGLLAIRRMPDNTERRLHLLQLPVAPAAARGGRTGWRLHTKRPAVSHPRTAAMHILRTGLPANSSDDLYAVRSLPHTRKAAMHVRRTGLPADSGHDLYAVRSLPDAPEAVPHARLRVHDVLHAGCAGVPAYHSECCMPDHYQRTAMSGP